MNAIIFWQPFCFHMLGNLLDGTIVVGEYRLVFSVKYYRREGVKGPMAPCAELEAAETSNRAQLSIFFRYSIAWA